MPSVCYGTTERAYYFVSPKDSLRSREPCAKALQRIEPKEQKLDVTDGKNLYSERVSRFNNLKEKMPELCPSLKVML